MTAIAADPAETDALFAVLVDDDPMWRFLTGSALRERGWSVEEYDTGAELLARLSAITPDIVLIDALMPGLDGFATCRAIRQLPLANKPPILMLTSLEDDESIRAAYDAGATDFFIKSTHWALLAERVRHLVRLSRVGRELARSNARLAKVHMAANVSAVEFEVATRTLRAPPGSFGILGLAPERTELSEQALMHLLDPADQARLRDTIAHCLRTRADFRFEFRLGQPGGAVQYFSAHGEPEYAADGTLHRIHGYIQDQTDDRVRRAAIERLSSHDAQTGLPNRDECLRRLAGLIEVAHTTGESVQVAVFNLDRFTQFNETLGQAAGDELICEVARRIAAVIGQYPGSSDGSHSDSNHSHRSPSAQASSTGRSMLDASGAGATAGRLLWLARLPGDEFALLLRGMPDRGAAQAVIESVLAAIRQVCHVVGIDIFLTASVGLASFPADADSAGMLLSRADRATREVKERGRNDVGWYLPNLEQGGLDRIEMVTGLNKALERGEFELHFQPLIDVPSALVTGFEALVRWRRNGKLVPPGDFIPLAEDTGLIVPIGEWVLREAARALARWRQEGVALDNVAINIPTVHFERDSLLSTVREALLENGLAPGAIELELTETCMVRDFERTLPRLEALIEAGATLSIDDFGTGYSSLAYLTRLPIAKLKVDRAFVNQLGVSRQGEAVCRAIVALGQSLGVQVLAEGVETAEQVSALLALGCRAMQGFLFSRPVPLEQVPQAIQAAEQVARRLTEPEMQPAPEQGLGESI